ncbi:PREDICTED: WD repeat-containing protein 88 [Nanorana parkeri]|uniref:WD repeat-containing protein 88 n=1 Tax=Nanorana parkeri TaxID=125878 RepID=UPI0008543864|nr:PREDICTED: WD repeat-containing protein 88 [Nanorana parkeri]
MGPLCVQQAQPVLDGSGESVCGSHRLSQIPFQILRGHGGAVSSCHFCCQDTKLLTCSHDQTAKLWDLSTNTSIRDYGGEHTAPISQCSPTRDDRRMVTSSYDKTVKFWDLETGKVLWSVSLDGLVTSCNVSGDGKLVVCSVDVDNAMCIIDSASASKVLHIKDQHTSTITRCCFDPESQRICSVSSDRAVKLWDVIAQRTTLKINGAHGNVISDCGFSNNGRLICTASWDKSIKLWDVNGGEYRRRAPDTLHAHSGSVSSCAFSEDGSTLVSGGYDRTIVVWDVNSACKKLVLKGHTDWVLDVAMSTNQKWILSASKDSTLRLWNIENCEEIPAVIQNKKAIGPRPAQCEECQKPFPIMHWDNANVIRRCVFCRLFKPSRDIIHPEPPTDPTTME